MIRAGLLALALAGATAAAADPTGRYQCTITWDGETPGTRTVAVQVDTSSRRLWIEDAEGTLEGSYVYRKSIKEKYEEYSLEGRAFRVAEDGKTTFHYCWGCGPYACVKE